MPAVNEHKLTLEEFHTRYGEEKPYYEYWAGQAVQKSMPTWLHALIQKTLLRLLDSIGYESAAEVTLKLDPAYEPIPDVIAVEGGIDHPYPSTPFDVVIEILSPQDSFSRTLRKCRLYEQWAIGASWSLIQPHGLSGPTKAASPRRRNRSPDVVSS